MYDSPSNAFFMDTGVATEWGREPAEEVIKFLGSRQRIGMVHFRNVIVVRAPDRSSATAPREESGHIHYIETFVNEGDADMAACMSALVQTGYTGGVDPDHTPRLLEDDTDSPLGWTLALGYIAALRDVYCSPASDGTARL
jgi:D-mannonate dehydratase